MLTVKVTGLKELQKRVSTLAAKQLPFAVATALNTTIAQAAAAEKAALPKVFVSPPTQSRRTQKRRW